MFDIPDRLVKRYVSLYTGEGTYYIGRCSVMFDIPDRLVQRYVSLYTSEGAYYIGRCVRHV